MATRQTTPPPLQGPTAKEKKYDRQLRLWAANGQKALEEANVLLLNSGTGVVGVETLKNLILPGVGNFTIVDEAVVSESDLGVNFFLTEESLGRSRAEESSKHLKELNPEVWINAVQESTEVYVSRRDVLNQHNLILLVGPTRSLSILSEISDYASRCAIPLFYIHSIGFYSHFSVQLPFQCPIVDTHPDPDSTQDLRLLNPWPKLLDFVYEKTHNLETLGDHEHGHVPYLLLLLHYLNLWKALHDDKPPSSYSEKKDFKAMVQQGARNENAESGEENYDEAAASVLKSLNPPSISTGLREVFEADDCKSLKPDSENFWVIAHAIRDFHTSHQELPLPGALPDMKAKSVDYIKLQNIYKAKAREDLAEVISKVRLLENELQRRYPVDEQEIEAFCKGAAFVKLIKGRPIRILKPSSPTDWDGTAKYLSQELQDDESLLPIHVAFLSYDYFIDNKGRGLEWKGKISTGENGIAVDFTGCMVDIISIFIKNLQRSMIDFNPEPCMAKTKDIIVELDRANGSELHNISALTGGIVAQEVIKVITKQYVPVENTCVFDGIISKAGVFKV